MEQPTGSLGTSGDGSGWESNEALELWKYFGGVGAADKNTMVTVGSWLLGFSAAIIAYVGTEVLRFDCMTVTEPYRGIWLSLLGVVISCVAAYVSLLYGGYSNWNWAKADAIARVQAARSAKWAELLPEKSKTLVEKHTTPGTPSWFAATANRFGRPCDPITELAPIFTLYVWLALSAVLLHSGVLFLSVCTLRH